MTSASIACAIVAPPDGGITTARMECMERILAGNSSRSAFVPGRRPGAADRRRARARR
jgi:hypothetical protein